MMPLSAVAGLLDEAPASQPPRARAQALLEAGETILEHWLAAKGVQPTDGTREGFRLLALHHQGAKGDPSFNACRESCRELVYYYNVIGAAPDDSASVTNVKMMRFVLNHLYLFVTGKMEVEGLGEFCCSSRSLRTQSV
jgi:hypothetical protein